MAPPLKYTAAQINEVAEAFFAKCDETNEPYTITGLAMALGCWRKLLCEYAERDDDIGYAVKAAKARVERYAECRLYGGSNAAGPIFALKNFGWSDKQTVEQTGPNGGPQEHKWVVEVVVAPAQAEGK